MPSKTVPKGARTAEDPSPPASFPSLGSRASFVFQANPVYYDILGRFRSVAFGGEPRLAWPAPERQGRVQPGDWAFIYVGGSKLPGIYAAGRVTAILPPSAEPPPAAGVRARNPVQRERPGAPSLRGRGDQVRRPSRLTHPRADITVHRYATNAPLVERDELLINGLPAGVHWRTVVPLTGQQGRWLARRLRLRVNG